MAEEEKSKQDRYYKKMLGILGSLTNLFSESDVPFLNYRITENLFCKAFKANNLARADVSVDAYLDKTGIGIKTFRDKNKNNSEKIAEFNKDASLFKKLSAKEKIQKISELRNARLEATKRIYKLNELKYHLISRKKGKISIYEEEMSLIDIKKIKNVKENKNVISFRDSKHEYSFNISKSTLYKKFITKKPLFEINVKIIDDPFTVLENKLSEVQSIYFKETVEKPFIILPLYSEGQKVHERSGLNQWNAGGRKRDFDEIYIQIPAWIHKRFPGFFPSRKVTFELILPDGSILDADVCQQNSKALTSKHNPDLGKWLLRDVLNLKKGELLTYKKLQTIGLDSVLIEKIDVEKYAINFKSAGTYEEFLKENK